MKTSVEGKIMLGFVASVLALLGMGWLSYRTTEDSIAANKWVTHTYKVIATVEQGRAILIDAETAQRGFLLTGDENFFKDARNTQSQVNDWLQDLKQLTSDNPEQQERLKELEPLISQRLTLLNNRIQLRREKGVQAAIDAVATREGVEFSQKIQKTLGEMRDAEGQLLVSREQTLRTDTRIAEIVVLSGSALAVVIGLMAILLIHRDLKQRARVEAELDRFFTLSLDFLCIASADGYFKRVSPAITDILGWSREEFLARPFLDFVHPDDRAATMREVENQIVSGRKVLNFENRYRHKDDSWRVLSWRSIPQPGGLMYATARDVTEQKRSEEKIITLNADLQNHARQLETANKELEAFSYSVSHDLRAPLRHIDGFVKLLEKQAGEKVGDQGRRYLNIIAAAAKRMSDLIDDLLIFSRMGRAELRRTKVAPESLVNEVVDTLQNEIRDRRIVWKLGALPEVEADPAMLRQVWANLIANAVKYTRPRDPAEIEIGCNDDNGEFVFHVRDNGVGFDMQYAHKLFGVFQRLHHAEDFEGTGIGLANVQRIVQRHGGRVWARGKIDDGATFFFSLPKTQTEAKG